uniref:Uncharacterized protein n=1 Tax=Anguilla anguilla TaxID=7936 RepID=A0A0E9QJC6_ANGAN
MRNLLSHSLWMDTPMILNISLTWLAIQEKYFY